MADETDLELLDRARRGEEAAFEQLYRRHHEAVFRFAYRLLTSEAQAEDVTHDCFLSILRRPDAFEPGRASLRTYLCAAARYLAFAQMRRGGVQVDLESAETLPDPRATPLERLLGDERADRVLAAVRHLPPLQREVVALSEYEEMTAAEIAEVVGTSAATVRARLQRAREHLRRWLADLIDVPEVTGGAEGRRK
jgi:RNA polymerase sigma-70 factor (ECF subfamily)